MLAALVAASASGVAIAWQSRAASNEKFQELADNAAIAGINALMKTEGLPDAVRIEAAKTAATGVVATKEQAATVLAPSTEALTMSVTLTRNASGKGAAVTARARYIEPGETVSGSTRQDATKALIRPDRG